MDWWCWEVDGSGYLESFRWRLGGSSLLPSNVVVILAWGCLYGNLRKCFVTASKIYNTLGSKKERGDSEFETWSTSRIVLVVQAVILECEVQDNCSLIHASLGRFSHTWSRRAKSISNRDLSSLQNHLPLHQSPCHFDLQTCELLSISKVVNKQVDTLWTGDDVIWQQCKDNNVIEYSTWLSLSSLVLVQYVRYFLPLDHIFREKEAKA